jgi:hypothetical protein
MNAILRVHGKKLKLSTILPLIPIDPYRIDKVGVGRAKTNCLHYDTGSPEEGDFISTIEAVMLFLHDNEARLNEIKKRPDVDGVVIDIGVVISDDMFASTYHLGSMLLALLVRLGISIEISVYKEGDGK